MKHQAKKQTRNQHMPVVIVCILILVLAVMGLGMHFIKKYIPTKERMNLTEYYGQPGDGEMAVVLGTEIMEERALMSGDQIYLPLDMVNTYLNQRYYWDSADQQVLYATPSELQYYPAAESGEGDVWLKDGTVYLRLGFVQKFTDLDAMYMKIRTELQSSTDLPECRQRQLKKIQVSVIRWNQVSDPDRCEDGGYINLSGRTGRLGPGCYNGWLYRICSEGYDSIC